MILCLAPMEGVVDFVLREFLTGVGGIDRCVTEFMRVTDMLLPEHVFYRYCPELKTNSKTLHGTPVYFQILGGNPNAMGENALRAANLGAAGIDINFGCPAKRVNSHDGGASLLKYPHRMYDIVKSVRTAVPFHVPVTAKIRLGYDSPTSCLENAKAVEEGGAQILTVHARTKTDGYRPPAHWEWIAKIKETIKIPIIANGEIWNMDDFQKCKTISKCDDFMIGRGALSNPFIFSQIKKLDTSSERNTPRWEDIPPILSNFFSANEIYKNQTFALARTKQWLKALAINHPQAKEIFDRLKLLTDPIEFRTSLEEL